MPRKNATHNLDSAIDEIERELDLSGGRFVQLAIDFTIEEAGRERVLLSAGGRWDRDLDDYDGDAELGVRVAIHPGQRAAVEWFRTWLEAHAGRRESPPPMPAFDGVAFEIDSEPSRVYSALFAGGRRAGKTWIAVAFAVAYALRFPGALVWIVSPDDERHGEVRRYLTTHLADAWLDRRVAFEYELANGSQIHLMSAYDPEQLKEGEAHFVVLNEGQRMKPRAFAVTRGAIVDKAGLVLVCANPPVGEKDNSWVTDFAVEAKSGRRAAIYLEMSPLENPHVDRVALLSMRAELDWRSYQIEVLGRFLPPAGAVAWNWERTESERAVPSDYIDVTSIVLAQLGEGDDITTVVGLDVQRVPWIGGPHWRLFVPPGVPASPETALCWIVGETVLEGGDEVDFCGAMLDQALAPARTLVVCDASGRYQHSRRRSMDAPPPSWTGRGSFDVIRGEGFVRIVPPDRMQKRNPEIVDRLRAFTSLISTATGVRRLFADPVRAPRTCESIREWKTVHGQASRTQRAAHLGDATSYVAIRLFPRRLRNPPKARNPPAMTKAELERALAAATTTAQQTHLMQLIAKLDADARDGEAP